MPPVKNKIGQTNCEQNKRGGGSENTIWWNQEPQTKCSLKRKIIGGEEWNINVPDHKGNQWNW